MMGGFTPRQPEPNNALLALAGTVLIILLAVALYLGVPPDVGQVAR